MSKIIEKSITYQQQDYLKQNGLLYKRLSGFNANFSNDLCFAQRTDFVVTDMNKEMHSGIILIDLKKTIDTLEQKILLERMACIAFKKSAIKWSESYLSITNFFVSVDDVFSGAITLNCGVFQGSILGALLIFYICIYI